MPTATTGWDLLDIRYLNARRDTYALLAALLIRAPGADFLGKLQHLQWPGDAPGPMARVWTGVRDAALEYPVYAVQKEFTSVFIGLGAGEVVPYASWYHDGLLMSGTLARLRKDLNTMGVSRGAQIHEAEDHAGLLCETMSLLGGRSGISFREYARFFDEHVASWMIDFFSDVQKAPSAAFYSSVAAMGNCLLQMEQAHLRKQCETAAG